MTRLQTLVFGVLAVTFCAAAAEDASPDKMPSKADLTPVRRTVELLRGKKFKHDVPVFDISKKEARARFLAETDKDHPGQEMTNYQELLTWLDVIPPGTDFRAAEADFAVDQVLAFYDTDTKEMCMCSLGEKEAGGKKPAEKELEQVPGIDDEIVLAHEYTHALEDQYWPLDDPKDKDTHSSTDRGDAHDFLAEGSATHLMIEAVPPMVQRDSPGGYFPVWNLIHSGLGQAALGYALGHSWRNMDESTNGVPPTLAQAEEIPYAYGYLFCADVMRKWGLDGLDYVYDHPPVSTEQIMHPSKYWEWRDFPVKIELADELPGGWKRLTGDNFGESGLAIFFGCTFHNPSRGLEIAHGWDGDVAALYQGASGGRLLVWASAWDSIPAAKRLFDATVKQRRIADKAEITRVGDGFAEWKRPDGRVGFLQRDENRVILAETDRPASLGDRQRLVATIKFTDPPEDAARAAHNGLFRRVNPIVSRQVDGDYHVTRTLCGLLSRHDRNAFGKSDRVLLGIVGELRRTESFNKWEIGAGAVAKHQSEARQGMSKTTLLPWGILASHCTALMPGETETRIERTSVVWGAGASWTKDQAGLRFHLLPFGLLYRQTDGPGRHSVHVLGTGVSRTKGTDKKTGATVRYRILGLPIWTHHEPAPA